MSKLDVDKHIDVEIKLDELDLTSAESKATYAQIKEYVWNKFQLKVSTLYIAQIKRKFCIIDMDYLMHVSYNWTSTANDSEEILATALNHELVAKFAKSL